MNCHYVIMNAKIQMRNHCQIYVKGSQVTSIEQGVDS